MLPSKQFQQRLLHAFAAHIAGDARRVALAADLVDLVDEDDAALSLAYIVVRSLEQAAQDALHILAHIARLGQHGGIGNGEGHVEHPAMVFASSVLPRTGLTHQDDVALLDLHIIRGGTGFCSNRL